jgi:hypothetical protein
MQNFDEWGNNKLKSQISSLEMLQKIRISCLEMLQIYLILSLEI